MSSVTVSLLRVSESMGIATVHCHPERRRRREGHCQLTRTLTRPARTLQWPALRPLYLSAAAASQRPWTRAAGNLGAVCHRMIRRRRRGRFGPAVVPMGTRSAVSCAIRAGVSWPGWERPSFFKGCLQLLHGPNTKEGLRQSGPLPPPKGICRL